MRLSALRAGWLTQTFLHWAYAPELIQRLLPDGLTVATYDGHAWVGLTPFVMADVRPPGSPVALAALPETNLRTYVRGPGDREGLWFLSIEVASPVMLAGRHRRARAVAAAHGPSGRTCRVRDPCGRATPAGEEPLMQFSGRVHKIRLDLSRAGVAAIEEAAMNPHLGGPTPRAVQPGRRRLAITALAPLRVGLRPQV
ncbi:hypothetical protein B1R27_00010 [Streptomyces sp. GKU 895]|nr:hypothetical protein B1R27_00010 [Streptomyces sp. GKU 895]